MGRVRTYRDDDILKPLLDSLPRRKESEIVRKALYDYFFKGNQNEITYSQPIQIPTIPISKPDINLPPAKEFNFEMFDD